MLHKNFVQRLFVILLFFSSASAQALPGLSVGLMGGGNLSVPSIETAGASISGKIGFSVGPTVEAGPLEVSALYSQYSSKISILGLEQTVDSKYIDVPVLYRLGVGLASIGVGGFYGFNIDSDSTGNESNYGAVASVRVKIPGGLFADGRFNLGLKESAGSKLSSAALLLGFNFL